MSTPHDAKVCKWEMVFTLSEVEGGPTSASTSMCPSVPGYPAHVLFPIMSVDQENPLHLQAALTPCGHQYVGEQRVKSC